MEFFRVAADALKAWAYISVWATLCTFAGLQALPCGFSHGALGHGALSSWGMEKCIKPVRRQAVVSLVVLTDAENREGTRAARQSGLK